MPTSPMFALALALSLAGLALGPALLAFGRGRAQLASTIEGLTLGLVPLLVLLRFLPHLYEAIGAAAPLLVALSFAGLWLAERRSEVGGHRLGRVLVVPTLTLHSLLDGASLALAFADGTSGSTAALLGAALVLHRLPEGLFLATVLTPAIGLRGMLHRLAAVGAATVVGALGGHAIVARVPDAPLHGLVAVGLGVMLRLVMHRHAPAPAARRARALGALGFVLGVLVVALVPSPDDVLRRAQPRELSLLESLGPLFIETAPSMLLGLLGAGLLHTFLPRHMASWLRGGAPLSQALRGVAFGVPLPVCSCGVLPLLRRMLLGGVPVAAAVAFAIATPELDVGGAALSLRLLGAPFTILRVVASLVVAVAVGVVVAAVGRSPSAASEAPPASEPALPEPPRGSIGARVRLAVSEAFGPSLDHLAAFYVIGLIVAAAVEAALDPALLVRLGAPLDVMVGALAAVPLYVCAQGTTPLAAVLVHKGLSVGAALAALMVGPATNLGVIGVLRRRLGWRAAAAFGAGNIVLAIAAGLLANHVVPVASVPEVHDLVAHRHFGFELVCAFGLGALLLASLFRLGPRAWFGAMVEGEHDHDHNAHDHGHAHHHAHGHAHHHGGHAHVHDEHGHEHPPSGHDHEHGGRAPRSVLAARAGLRST